jgi:membrane-associated phospholipid phosphatase
MSANTTPICSGLLMAIISIGTTCFAQSQGQELRSGGATPASANEPGSEAVQPSESTSAWSAGNSQIQGAEFTESRFGFSLVKNMMLDQEAIWTSPTRWRLDDANWLLPFAGIAAASLISDTQVSKALTHSTIWVNRSNAFSNYGIAAFGGIAGGMYLLGKITDDDHKRETAMLSGEAAVNALGVSTALQHAFGRQRPGDGNGGGGFWRNGTSFPSDHATAAWAVASVIAHEYPGPLTKLLAYGLASAVSASRITGKDHFPTDVLAGAAIGWFTGQFVYHHHHDPELGGSVWRPIGEIFRDKDPSSPANHGSPHVPLDSWVYPAFEHLMALGYVESGLVGMKPWTRLECARLVDEAGEAIEQQALSGANPTEDLAVSLHDALAREFASKTPDEDGSFGTARVELESVYTRVTSISGPPLTDGFHFGQTISYDFGRPFRRGTNEITGAAVRAEAGPFFFYLRAEYQHAPAAPALPESLRNLIATVDVRSVQPASPFPDINRLDILEANVGFNLRNWQILLGKQSIDWSIMGNDSLLLSDNAEPIPMLRIDRIVPARLPGLLSYLGPVRTEFFVGRLNGQTFIEHPFIYGQKISVKPNPYLEIGYSRDTMLGGQATAESNQLGISIDAFNSRNFFESLVGAQILKNGVVSSPGNSQDELDFSLRIPRLTNGFVLYSELYQEDEPIFFRRPSRAAIRPGLYLAQVPRVPKSDFRLEMSSTESPGSPFRRGTYNYWHIQYRDGQTNDGNLLGSSVGREGEAIQAWWKYRFSATNFLQFSAKLNRIDPAFIPQGGRWQDYSVQHEIHLSSGFYLKSLLQLEHISHYPVLFGTAVNNVTASLEIGFIPGHDTPRGYDDPGRRN